MKEQETPFTLLQPNKNKSDDKAKGKVDESEQVQHVQGNEAVEEEKQEQEEVLEGKDSSEASEGKKLFEKTPEGKSEEEEGAESGEGGEGEEQPEVEVEVSDNIHRPVAELLKENKYLPEDFEIGDDLDPDKLEEEVISHYREKVESRIKGEVAKDLRKHGVDPQLAEINRIKSYGVTDQDLKKLQVFNHNANIDIDSEAENYEEVIEGLGKQYFKFRGIDEADIEDYVATDMSKYDLDELLNKYKSDFAKKGKEVQKTIQTRIQEGKQQEQEREAQQKEEIRKKLDSGELDGRKYTKDQISYIRESLTEPTERIKDEDGNTVKVTRLEKLRTELSQDPEKELRLIADYLLGYDHQDNEETGKVKGKRSFMNSLNQAISVKTKQGNGSEDITKKLFEPLK